MIVIRLKKNANQLDAFVLEKLIMKKIGRMVLRENRYATRRKK